jgi:hypothetical protein
MEQDIYADKPWALSPAFAGMSNISIGEPKAKNVWVDEHTVEQVETARELPDEKSEISSRRKWFADQAHRQALPLKDLDVGMEFANGLLGEPSPQLRPADSCSCQTSTHYPPRFLPRSTCLSRF